MTKRMPVETLALVSPEARDVRAVPTATLPRAAMANTERQLPSIGSSMQSFVALEHAVQACLHDVSGVAIAVRDDVSGTPWKPPSGARFGCKRPGTARWGALLTELQSSKRTADTDAQRLHPFQRPRSLLGPEGGVPQSRARHAGALLTTTCRLVHAALHVSPSDPIASCCSSTPFTARQGGRKAVSGATPRVACVIFEFDGAPHGNEQSASRLITSSRRGLASTRITAAPRRVASECLLRCSLCGGWPHDLRRRPQWR